MSRKSWIWAGLLVVSAFAVGVSKAFQERIHRAPVSSGRTLSPLGTAIGIGSFPCNMAVSADGRWIAVTDAGADERLTILDGVTGEVVDDRTFNDNVGKKQDGLFYGLRFAVVHGSTQLFVSRSTVDQALQFSVDENGKLGAEPKIFEVPTTVNRPVAGVSYETAANLVHVVVNGEAGSPTNAGAMYDFDEDSGKLVRTLPTAGYPLDVATVGDHTFVSSERDGTVSCYQDGKFKKSLKVGKSPTQLLISQDGKKIFVAVSGSDSIAVIDPMNLKVLKTILVRPSEMRGLPGATPLGMAEADHGKTLYVALGDLNAVAKVDLASSAVKGFLPTGWYPTAVALTQDESKLLVVNAKGMDSQNPNGSTVPKAKRYVLNVIQGALETIDLGQANSQLEQYSTLVLDNARLLGNNASVEMPRGIKHVFYIIKENRTYDQVLGDEPSTNADPSLTLYGREVTPNLHALAERFGLYDDFYTCADVSGDGWNWSTSGMISEYNARNVVHDYTGRTSQYDFEGTNDGRPVDLDKLPDVNEAPCGYLWDDALKHGVTIRNYGFYVSDSVAKTASGQSMESAVKRNLRSLTDPSFREFDTDFADGDQWVTKGFSAPRQMKSYGAGKFNSRFQAWKEEFDQYVSNGKLPALSFLRIMRDHTAGTEAGNYSPRAMVADNDYAIGEIIDTISHSPYWKSSLICIVEDDSQGGYDHVDCHRSPVLIVSPYARRGTVDGAFYNTDSVLRTMEVALGMPPMNSYDATASIFRDFDNEPKNIEPYDAIQPDVAIASEVNTAKSYRAFDSKRLIPRLREDSAADLQLNDILWGAAKGAKSKRPPVIGYSPLAKDDDD